MLVAVDDASGKNFPAATAVSKKLTATRLRGKAYVASATGGSAVAAGMVLNMLGIQIRCIRPCEIFLIGFILPHPIFDRTKLSAQLGFFFG